ncbi:hypothetical protein Tco_0024370 [Tanacetum coccineum]
MNNTRFSVISLSFEVCTFLLAFSRQRLRPEVARVIKGRVVTSQALLFGLKCNQINYPELLVSSPRGPLLVLIKACLRMLRLPEIFAMKLRLMCFQFLLFNLFICYNPTVVSSSSELDVTKKTMIEPLEPCTVESATVLHSNFLMSS